MKAQKWQEQLAEDNTELTLKILIIAWLISIFVLVLFVHNKWILAAILLYEVLP